MLRKHSFILIASLLSTSISTCFGMVEMPTAKSPTINSRMQSEYRYEDPLNRAKERANSTYAFTEINRFNNPPEIVKAAEVKRRAEIDRALQEAANTAAIAKPVIAQELYLQEVLAEQERNNIPVQKIKTITPIAPQELFFPEHTLTVPAEQKVASQVEFKEEPFFLQQATENLPAAENNSYQSSQPLISAESPNALLDMTRHLPEEITSKFEIQVNKTLFKLLKKTLRMTSAKFAVEVSLADLIAEYLQEVIFDFSNLSQNIHIPQSSSYNNFKMQLQYLTEQMRMYNNKTVYNSPDDLVTLIQIINQFLKNNNVIYFSQEMFTKLDEVLTTAIACCDIIRNKNMILTSSNEPKPVLLLFQSAIDNTNALSKITYSHDIMRAIYNKNGYMYDIMQTWSKFKSSDLNKISLDDASTTMNYQYGAFLTLLLLFENTLVAAAIIIDETSTIYKVTNPIPVVISIQQ